MKFIKWIINLIVIISFSIPVHAGVIDWGYKKFDTKSGTTKIYLASNVEIGYEIFNNKKDRTEIYLDTALAGLGGGDLIHSGTPTIHQWGIFIDSTHVKGLTVTPSKVVCTGSNGEPVACINLTDLAFSDYVPKSLYDAYSILYADSDNTPTPLTVDPSRIVGRKSTGGMDDNR